jgi:uncharacterized surface protein with fasciclin (FAS1) repeats
MENNNKTGIIVGAVVLIALIAGGLIWMMDDDEVETSTDQTETTQTETVEQQSDIVELAVDTESLSTLVTAVQAADLVETLQADGPYTVFAPTNEAFEALPDGILDSLLEPENKQQLSDILTYHVVPAEVFAADLTDGQQVTTVLGETLTIELRGGMVYIVDATGGEAMVQTADVDASNGVVHVIDSVLLPS